MRVAQVAPLAEAVPPKLYGGTERVVSYLTEELVSLGHDVTLFASGDSVTAAELVPILSKALRLDQSVRDPLALTVAMIETVARRASEFDVVHFHIDHLHLPLFTWRKLPFLTTLHGRLDLPELAPTFRLFPDARFVSISNAQRRPLPFLNWAGTVHHGLPTDFPGRLSEPRGYLAFLGRISPEKGPDRAIEIAARSGMPLKMAAKVDNADLAYYEAEIRPMLREYAGIVEFIGEIDEQEKSDFLGGAAGLLFPVDWPEPFGLVMIEAMACGTPVIGFDRGSVREVVDHGTTGFVVSDVAEAAAATKHLQILDRARIRNVFATRFTARRMALDYLDLYESIASATSAIGVAEAAE
jgi:glycosyltransferase involved in cell wall biosynthesis